MTNRSERLRASYVRLLIAKKITEEQIEELTSKLY